MKQGDHIFYRSKEHGMYPTVVHKVREDRLKIEGPKGNFIWVNASNCQLQEDWRKENDQ